jgi:hypothetical protein
MKIHWLSVQFTYNVYIYVGLFGITTCFGIWGFRGGVNLDFIILGYLLCVVVDCYRQFEGDSVPIFCLKMKAQVTQ